MNRMRQAAGLVAAVLLVAVGVGLWYQTPLFGAPLIGIGLGFAVWHFRRLRAARPDPYDLSRLWEREPEPPEEPDEDAVEDEGTLYCHSCGHAVPREFPFCPECRRPLR